MLKAATLVLSFFVFTPMALGFDFSNIFSDRGDDYELQEFPAARLDQIMNIPGLSNDIPERLQGLWWLDGNRF